MQFSWKCAAPVRLVLITLGKGLAVASVRLRFDLEVVTGFGRYGIFSRREHIKEAK
jgi:hypothetical protein